MPSPHTADDLERAQLKKARLNDKRKDKEDAVEFAFRIQNSLNERIYHLTRENEHLRSQNRKLLGRLGEIGYYEFDSLEQKHIWVEAAPKEDNCQEEGVDSDYFI